MQLVNFGPAGLERPGVDCGERILDVVGALTRRGHHAVSAMVDLISLPEWRLVVDTLVTGATEADYVTKEGLRLGPPVTRPPKVLVVGANTYSHVKEAAVVSKGRTPNRPMIVAKASTAVVGPYDDVVCPTEAVTMDYEVELGVIIGQAARHVTVEDAYRYIAGYTVVNDMSDRNLQTAAHEDVDFYRGHYLGKSYDGFCPAGPALITPDEVGDLLDPASITLRSYVNDDLRQDSDLTDLCFGVPELVSYMSGVMTLLPGDLICTGSPAGVGAFRNPPAYLRPGDTVRTEVGRVGVMVNRIVAPGNRAG
ncbi:fumarylacetoacetate hydrolase family protein [Amycolatopsis pithecellobii]|uniref:fumarylacetoacetate hydrolase family protein n=1 Tax=Amycolatopsis pithecellobii TaxID=664692 RepID=UPI0014089164|nr:fumarylacetoacetate hydrolase family protein [Amycolatopsis pithecellobii]